MADPDAWERSVERDLDGAGAPKAALAGSSDWVIGFVMFATMAIGAFAVSVAAIFAYEWWGVVFAILLWTHIGATATLVSDDLRGRSRTTTGAGL